MSNEATEKFIEEGIKRYKEASKVMVSFGEQIESKLKSILENRNEWTNFTKLSKEARAKSTKYWSKYPLLNAKLKGKLKHKDEDIEILIGIAISWYESDLDYPLYSLWMKRSGSTLEEKFKQFEEEFERFEWGSNCKYVEEKQIVYIPKSEDFNLERDFNILLDEFNRFLNVL